MYFASTVFYLVFVNYRVFSFRLLYSAWVMKSITVTTPIWNDIAVNSL